MGKLKNTTFLHLAIYDNDIKSVNEYANTDLLNVGCRYEISDIIFYQHCAPLHLALLTKKTEIAEILLQQDAIDINLTVELIQIVKNHMHKVPYRPIDLAMNYKNIKIIDLLLSKPDINLHLYDLERLMTLLMEQHDEKYMDSVVALIKKCEEQLFNITIKEYEERPNEQKNYFSKRAGGISRTEKLAATVFLKNNSHKIQTIEKHKDYNTHKKALTQGSKKPKKMHSNLYKFFSTLKEAESTIEKLKNPSEQDELELKTFSSSINGPR